MVPPLDLKLILTPESHNSLDWKFQFSATYIPRFAHATLQLLGSGGDNTLEWWMLFISVVISTISMFMTTSAYITTCTQFSKH